MKPIIQITPPNVKVIEKNNISIEQYDYDDSHLIYRCSDLGSLKEISNMKKENCQLKEQNKLEFNDFIKLKKEQEDRHLEKTSKLIKEKQHLKQALIDIRKYINHEWFKREQIGVCNKELQQWEIENILQIIDKVLDLEKVRSDE